MRDLAARRVSIDLPSELVDALHAEAVRRYTTPSKLLREVLVDALPDFVASGLRRDLAPIVETSGRSACPDGAP